MRTATSDAADQEFEAGNETAAGHRDATRHGSPHDSDPAYGSTHRKNRRPHPGLHKTPTAPGSRPARTHSACAFCHITEARPDPGDRAEPQDDPRVITHANTHAIALPNLYPLLGGASANHDPYTPPGQSAIILTRRHATSLEELSPDESRDLAELIAEVCAELDGKYLTVAAFANIGEQAGSTQPHLHVQVVAADTPNPPRCREHHHGSCAVCADHSTATQAGLLIDSGPGWAAYAPSAPAHNLELRITLTATRPARPTVHTEHTEHSPHTEPHTTEHGPHQAVPLLLDGARRCLTRLTASGHQWPYNLIWHHNHHHPHARLLLRIDPGVVYLTEFGVTPISTSLPEFARTLREATT